MTTASPFPPGGPEHDYVAQRRAKVDGFVRRQFTWPGTLRLHRSALGWDVLRAPINVMLSPVLVLALTLAWVFRRLRLPRAAGWLARRQILLPTSVSRNVERLIVTDLLDVPLPPGRMAGDRAALSRAILAAPQFRDIIRSRGSVDAAEVMVGRMARALQDYAGTRSAVADMTSALVALTVGALAFQALTPGMVSMAPGVAEAVSRTTAVADFPLGRALGGLWYGAFPVGASAGLVVATVAVLVMLGSVVAAFAGVLADPVQARFGIHRRRLLRLIDTLEAELAGADEKPFAAREHFYARAIDLWDAAVSVLRALLH